MKSYIRKVVAAMAGYQPGEQPRLENLVKLNTNECPYPPSPHVRDVLTGYDPNRLRLYPDPLCHELREAIAQQHGCAADQVFIGNGADEILALCLRAFVEKDGAVGYFDPSYSLYPILAQIEELETRPVALGSNFDWNMPAQYRANLFYLTYPNAPTGLTYPQDKVRAFCANFDGTVIIDEAYVDFAKDNCMKLALSEDNVLVARSFSKSYALAGIRLGYAIGPAQMIEALFKVKDSYNISRLTQAMALAAFLDQAYLRDIVHKICQTREFTTQELTARGFSVIPSQSNFVFARPPSKIAARDLFERLRAERIFVRHFRGGRTEDYLRITIGTEEQMEVLLSAIDHILSL